MAFKPEPISDSIGLSQQELLLYILRHLELIADELDALRAVKYTSAPKNPSDGMIVIADGTSWDPGSGAGFYGYRDGAWRALEV